MEAPIEVKTLVERGKENLEMLKDTFSEISKKLIERAQENAELKKTVESLETRISELKESLKRIEEEKNER